MRPQAPILAPDQTANTIPAAATAEAARAAGLAAEVAGSVEAAVASARAAGAGRALVCGSLYLAGHVMRENG